MPPPRSTNEYGAIGNLHTAALVSRYGSVDWACLPRFASPSVFARLLDVRKGGHFVLAPIEPSASYQHYRNATNVLDTTFELGQGRRLVLTDFMPVGPAPDPEGRAIIVRRARAIGGPVPLRILCAPRFDYGRKKSVWIRGDRGDWIARSSTGEALTLTLPMSGEPDGPAVLGDMVALPARPLYCSIAWGTPREPLRLDDGLLDANLRFWRRWAHSADAPFHGVASTWHEWVLRSELALKLLSQATSGAFVAAPTTSLPEWPGGPRNWDYRFVWIRDAAFTAEVLLALGHVAEARSFLGWVLDRLARPDGYPLRVLYGAHGEQDLAEHRLTHLAGFLGSRPVRIGNAASHQWQLDIFGELFDGARLLARLAPRTVERGWPLLAPVADFLLANWRRKDQGIWESRARPAHDVHSKVMAWVGLDRAAQLAELADDRERRDRYRVGALEVREAVLEKGFDGRTGSFVRSFGSRDLDAANLRIPQVGFLPFNDDRIRGTLLRIERELARGPFLLRYTGPDGVSGPEGTFLPCAFWRVEVVARSGEVERARELLRQLLCAASPVGLFAEEYDPVSQIPLGNYPQAFSHVAFLRAVLAVEAPRVSAESLAAAVPLPALARKRPRPGGSPR